MPISKKDNLHLLIKSLTKNEKKFFRNFLKNQSESKLYLLLFNKIDQQSKHQKLEIKKIFDNKANQLPVIRTYLSKILGKVLNLYHRESTDTDIFYNNLLEINLLLERELFDLAESKINKCIELSNDLNSPLLEFNALELRRKFLLKKFSPTSEECKKEMSALLEKQTGLLNQLLNLNQLQQVQATFYDHFQQSSGLNPVIYSSLDGNPLLGDDRKALSFEAKLLQADLNYRLQIFKNKNFLQADQTIQKAIRQLEMSPRLIANQPETYLNLLNQRLQLLIHQKKIAEIQEVLGKIRQAPATYNFDSREPSLRRPMMEAFALELGIYRQTGDKNKAEQLIRQITAEYKDLNSPLLRQWKTVMDYEIARYYWETGKLNQALQKIKLIQAGEYSQREAGVLLRSIFLRAQIALMQKNNLELKKVSAQLRAHFINVKKASRLEKNLLVFLELWPSCHGAPKKRRKLSLQLVKILKAAEKNNTPELQDLPEWLAAFWESQTAAPSAR